MDILKNLILLEILICSGSPNPRTSSIFVQTRSEVIIGRAFHFIDVEEQFSYPNLNSSALFVARVHIMKTNHTTKPNPNERLLRFLLATPEQQALIDKILEGKMEVSPAAVTGPLLLPMGKAAKLLGVSRATLWRMLKATRLTRVEILPGAYQIRRSEIVELVFGHPNSSTTTLAPKGKK